MNPTRTLKTSCNMAQQPPRAPHPNPSPPSPPTAAADPPPVGFFFFIIPLISLAFLTYNSIAAIRRSIHDPWTVAFVSASYIDVLLIYCCLLLIMRTPVADSRRHQRLDAALWLLTFILTVMFTYRVALIMPPAIAVFFWVLSAVTVTGGFYVLFLYKEAPEEAPGKKSSDACENC